MSCFEIADRHINIEIVNKFFITVAQLVQHHNQKCFYLESVSIASHYASILTFVDGRQTLKEF